MTGSAGPVVRDVGILSCVYGGKRDRVRDPIGSARRRCLRASIETPIVLHGTEQHVSETDAAASISDIRLLRPIGIRCKSYSVWRKSRQTVRRRRLLTIREITVEIESTLQNNVVTRIN